MTFEKTPYTPGMRDVLKLSMNEAGRLGHDYIGPEHYLLGIIRMNQGVAIHALRNLDVDLDELKRGIEARLEKGKGPAVGLFAPNAKAKRILELAHAIAQQLNHGWIGTEHLLLALIRAEDTIPSKCLLEFGVDFEKAQQEIVGLIEGHNAAAPAPESANPSDEMQTGGARGDKSKTPALDNFARDLTQLAREGKLDPVIGREAEMERILQILCRRTKNNPILLGESGVGKTAIVEGLAQKIINNDIPELLANKRLLSLDLAAIVAGTKYRGQFEERLKQIMLEIRRSNNIIIFIDEIHTLVGAGAAEGAIDASSMLKPALSRGELQCIGATTLEEYRKHIEKDGALERRFQTIRVNPPNSDEAVKILQGLRSRYEEHHNIIITDDAVRSAVRLSTRYISDRALPDKAIDLIDEAGSRARLTATVKPDHIKGFEKRIADLDERITRLSAEQEFEECHRIKLERDQTREELDKASRDWRTQMRSEENRQTIREDDIAMVVSKWTGVPVTRLEEKETELLMRMEEDLAKRVVSQEEAIKAITRAIRRSRSGLKDPARPTGTFVFLGPTGVGKTELAKALAELLFGNEDALIRVDMSEYMEKFAVSRLVGAPPGYVGYDEGGQLTEKVRQKPYSVVLLDEIEKAHPDVFSLLLQVLDEGRLTDSFGHVVDFRNTVVILTSNIGTKLLKRGSLGFRSDDQMLDHEAIKSRVLAEMRKIFNPEFINRFDEAIVFKSLTADDISKIIDIMLGRTNSRLAERNIGLTLSENARRFLVEKGYNSEYGARPLRRAIQQYVEDPLSVLLLEGKITSGDQIEAILGENEQIHFEIKRPETPHSSEEPVASSATQEG
ncbi:MAG TPA: ATP-dependent Clp protease ATP-binding subunit [Candidatus Sumerlaeota bacterium]|nr:ATP-dependent Clp protease ATP-binding subunit [Candidatus Sumerlaeota bacterium]